MILPQFVLSCMDALEAAGFSAHAVGGCVRDRLLGREPTDYDLCTDALPDEIRGVFSDARLVLAGVKHGTVGVVTENAVVEITTYRKDGEYSDNRHPNGVTFVRAIEDDLARRDFTVNAMAFSPRRGFCDPFGGREDLTRGILRAVGDPETRFREDSLRILRGIRFAAKYRLQIENATLCAMTELAPLCENLARERVFEELCKFLTVADADDLTRFSPVLACVIPELAPTVGFDQRSPHHAYDLFTHIAHVTAAVPATPTLRWAALLHDVGKIPCFTTDENGRGHFYGHAQTGATMADTVLRRLKAPTALREDVVQLVTLHMTKIEAEKKAVRRALGRIGKPLLMELIFLQEADMGSKGTGVCDDPMHFSQLRDLIAEAEEEDACFSLKQLAVNGNDLIALGFSGREIGQTLHTLLSAVMDETIENEKTALIEAAKKIRR